MLIAACGGDSATPAPAELDLLDSNGDGDVVIGIAAAGPVDDEGYYEAVSNGAAEFADQHGWAAPIVVDDISAEDAATELENLAQQGVDIIVVGATEIASPMADLAERYSELFWYCHCGSGWPESEFYAQSQDDSSELQYTNGVAIGLKLRETGGDSVVMLGCCHLGFETESFMAMELGLQSVDPSFSATYVPTGRFPFDFDNLVGATEAFNAAVAEGADAFSLFLGGPLNAIGQLANESGVLAISGGPADVCERENVAWDIGVRYDGGEYLHAVFTALVNGEFEEGKVKVFHVGVDPEPGAVICDPTQDQQTFLDSAYASVASGDLADEFEVIKGEAHAS